jgi:chitinase
MTSKCAAVVAKVSRRLCVDSSNEIFNKFVPDNYRKAVELRKINPDLKVLIAIGGWNEGSARFSNMSSTATNRQTFIAR